MQRKVVFCLAVSALAGGAVMATASCSSLADSASLSVNGDAGQGEGGSERPSADGGAGAAPQLEANGIVLVHAASFPAFRICFEGAAGERPLPSTELMPESNVVGVDVGSAIRLPPHSGTLGRAFVFPELALRALYPAFGGETIGPTCENLLLSNKSDATLVGSITEDLAFGVHALILHGCQTAARDPQATTDRCGDDWTPATGNLQLQVLALKAYVRPPSVTGLPVQIVQLSPALARLTAGRSVGVAFGDLDREGGAAPAPFIEGALPFATPVPNPPAVLAYEASDLASYATSGVFVTLGGQLDGGGPDAGGRQLLVAQSLEEIQRRSASRSLPSDWFAVASSYVVVSVGEPSPVLADGGPDGDPRRALHLLAIPLAAPDAGAAPDAAP